MRMRCPAENYPLEVPDHLVGTPIRCRYCGAYLVVDTQERESSSQQVHEGPPPGVPQKPDPKQPSNLEHQIYDGLPPLSVMLALRRQQGGPAYDQDELHRRYPMTDDDWKALAAFEKALQASAALNMAFWIGLAALAANALVWAGTLGFIRSTLDTVPPNRLLTVGLFAMLLGVGITYVHAGTDWLSRITLGFPLNLLPWATLMLAATFVGSVVWNLMRMFSGELHDWLWPAHALSAAGNFLALVATASAAFHVFAALPKIRPPEISHRLVEALKYLA